MLWNLFLSFLSWCTNRTVFVAGKFPSSWGKNADRRLSPLSLPVREEKEEEAEAGLSTITRRACGRTHTSTLVDCVDTTYEWTIKYKNHQSIQDGCSDVSLSIGHDTTRHDTTLAVAVALPPREIEYE